MIFNLLHSVITSMVVAGICELKEKCQLTQCKECKVKTRQLCENSHMGFTGIAINHESLELEIKSFPLPHTSSWHSA
jgi:hypothetical protein